MTLPHLGELAHQLELLPVAAVVFLRPAERAYWWLAGAYLVSYLADYGAHLGMDPWTISAVYPVAQAAVVVMVFQPPRTTLGFLGVLLVVGLVARWIEDPHGPAVWLRVVAWGGVVGTVLALPRQVLRSALLWTFGGGLACWLAFAFLPSLSTWVLYKIAWTVGTLIFCWAVAHPQPKFTILRGLP